ncbi:MAG: restriction endonuclease subunit S [Gammaproteobacteria bacterium AqS3]|nr:restriction endonuclease subunit S [Gammaproteobacteria bacterium AqS3]
MSDFSGFDDVPVLSLDELVTQGEIELGRGNIISKTDIRNQKGNYPIYSSSAKNNGKMGEYGKYMFNEELVTWSVDGGGAFFHRSKHKFSITNVSGYMRASPEKFNYIFLHGVLDYQHSFLDFDYQTKAHPSVIRKLYNIPIPPLSEQNKIAAILTAVDEAIENIQKQIDKLQDLKKATMNELLTKGIGHTEFKDSALGQIPQEWLCLPLQALVKDYKGALVDGPFGSNLKISDYVDSGVPVLQGKNITNDKFVWSGVRYITPKKAEELSRSSVKVGDILIVKIGSIGYSAIIDNLSGYDLAIIPANLLKIDIDEMKAITEYVHHYLTSPIGKQRLIDAASSTAQPALSLGTVKRFRLPIPSLCEQMRISAILTSIDCQISVQTDKLCQLQSLKISLMQDLLTGKARVNHAELNI